MTPFKALYGHDPPLLLKGTTIPSRVESVNQLQKQRDEILKELKTNLCKARDQNRVQANKHKHDVVYQVGDWVFLKLQPNQLWSLARKPNEKLSPRFYGPYQIVECIGQVVNLQLLKKSCIHPIFHASLLKQAVQPATS